MANQYFNHDDNRIPGGSLARADQVNNIGDEIAAAFDLVDQQDSSVPYLVAEGTGNVIILNNVSTTEHVDGDEYWFRSPGPNVGAATLNVAGIGAIEIVNAEGASLLAGVIMANGIYNVRYSEPLNKFILVSASGDALQQATAAAASAVAADASAAEAAASAVEAQAAVDAADLTNYATDAELAAAVAPKANSSDVTAALSLKADLASANFTALQLGGVGVATENYVNNAVSAGTVTSGDVDWSLEASGEWVLSSAGVPLVIPEGLYLIVPENPVTNPINVQVYANNVWNSINPFLGVMFSDGVNVRIDAVESGTTRAHYRKLA